MPKYYVAEIAIRVYADSTEEALRLSGAVAKQIDNLYDNDALVIGIDSVNGTERKEVYNLVKNIIE